jgi:hypothetical protein
VNLGGSGVMASGWNVNATVRDCEFKWLGECAVIGAGLGGDAHDNTAPSAPVGRGLTLQRNLAHELGLFVKQSGFYYHAMGANVSVLENVFFNGPRAGVNINDGFGGGHEISRNVGFNMVVSLRRRTGPARCAALSIHTLSHAPPPLPSPPFLSLRPARSARRRTTAPATRGTGTRTRGARGRAARTRCPRASLATCCTPTTTA